MSNFNQIPAHIPTSDEKPYSITEDTQTNPRMSHVVGLSDPPTDQKKVPKDYYE